MISIGIRVSPKKIFYSIVAEENGQIKIIDLSTINVPQALNDAEKLRHIRTTLIDIIAEYKAKRAGIRLVEPSAQSVNTFRLNIEGVILELFASSSIEKYFFGVIANIAALLGLEKRKLLKEYIDGSLNYEGIQDWAKYSNETRESILTAISALNI